MNTKDNTEAVLEFPSSDAFVRTLGNGLEIIVKEDHAAPVVSLQAWCRTGSIHEGEWLGSGMSHFLEHMLFKGTEHRSASDVAKEVQSAGGYINAYTSFDRTVYWIDCPSTGFDSCLEVLCDVVGYARIPEDEFEREQEVIRREFAMGDDNPGQVISKMLFQNAYTVHPCRYPVIGHLDLFNQLSREDLYQYYRETYSPDNIFIVVAGAVDTASVISQIEEQLGGLERRRRANPVLPEEPSQLGSREEVIDFPTELSRARIAWQIPDQTHPDVPALDLLASILGSGRSSRLFQAVRERLQLAHSVSTYAYTPACRGIFVLSVDSEPDKLREAEAAAICEIDKIKNDGVCEDELRRVRNQALSAQFSTLADVKGLASDLGSNWHTTRNLDFTRMYVDELQKVTSDEIRESASRYLLQDRTTRVAVIPRGAAVRRDNGTAHRKRSEDIRKVQLENGLTVLLLADHRVPFVQATASFRGGRLSETSELQGITRLMGRLLTKDTASRSSVEIANAIEAAGGGISASVGNNTFGTSAGALKMDLGLVVELLGDSVQNPAFLEPVLEKEKQFQISAIKAESDQPFSAAIKRYRKEMFGHHPYSFSDKGTVDTLASLDRDKLAGFRESLVTGANGIVGVFGDLDLAEAEDRVRAQFDNLEMGNKLFEGGQSGLGDLIPSSYGQIVEETHEKEQAILLIGYRTCDLSHDDNYSIGLIDEACSDMASRMFIRIREELGLAYSVGCMRMLGFDTGHLTFYAATSSEKLDLVQEEMIDEIGKLKVEGLAADEFDRAQNSWLGREVIHLQGVRELAGVATVDELVGLGWDHYRHTPDKIKSLTQDETREVANKYLRDDNRVVVRLTRG